MTLPDVESAVDHHAGVTRRDLCSQPVSSANYIRSTSIQLAVVEINLLPWRACKACTEIQRAHLERREARPSVGCARSAGQNGKRKCAGRASVKGRRIPAELLYPPIESAGIALGVPAVDPANE